jgi:hypothetical protein
MRKLVESHTHLPWERHDATCTGNTDNAFTKHLPLIFLCHAPSRRQYNRFISSKNTVLCNSFTNVDPPTNAWDFIFSLAFLFDNIGTWWRTAMIVELLPPQKFSAVPGNPHFCFATGLGGSWDFRQNQTGVWHKKWSSTREGLMLNYYSVYDVLVFLGM